MTDAEIARMGEYARQALDNPALSEALKRLHELALEQFKRTDIRDAEGLKLARQFAAVTDDFETILKRMVEGGRRLPHARGGVSSFTALPDALPVSSPRPWGCFQRHEPHHP